MLIAIGTGIIVFATQFSYGQGTILFQNDGPGLTTQSQIRDVLGALIPAGNAYPAELFWPGRRDVTSPLLRR